MANNDGYAIFQPVGINIDYVHVDLSKKQVTATISYQQEVKMTIITDYSTGQMSKEGNLMEILAALPSKDEESYFKEIYDWSRTFIEHDISDPQKYFEEFE